MKIMTIQVPDDSVEFVEEFVERIGGNVEEKELIEAKPKKEKKAKAVKKEKPLDSFGAWIDIDLDPVTYREKLWRKIPQL